MAPTTPGRTDPGLVSSKKETVETEQHQDIRDRGISDNIQDPVAQSHLLPDYF